MGNLIGQRLGHFRIDAKLGEGGMGVVYRATDDALRRQVALKVLAGSFASDAELRTRFLREARSAAAVTHANIATVHEVGDAEGHLFIAMELIEGETLRARIEKGLPIAESVRIARDIARGLARAHERGVIHRDLKPENVMLTPADELKILDFGLAKLREPSSMDPTAFGDAMTEEHLTEEGRVLGTPAYMAPEQARGEPVDARADVYSFGVMLFEMLTGQRPFGGPTAIAILLAASRDAPKRASELNPEVSPQLDSLVARCLAKTPDERHADGKELLEALKPLLPQSTEIPIAEDRDARNPSAILHTPGPPLATSNGSRRWLWQGLALAGLAALGFGLARRAQRATAPATPLPAASASSAPAPVVTRIVDLPQPRTTSSEAAAEYASGLQAIHDDNWWKAHGHFEMAAGLDPSMAAAHLRLSMVSLTDPVKRRAEYEKAVGLRATLDERDRDIMEALQPYLQSLTQDTAETERRLQAFARKHPTDVEVWMWLGNLHEGSPDGLAAADRALALDPADAQSWENRGKALRVMGRLEEARAAFEECAKISVDGADCFIDMALTDAVGGRCADFERDARRAADRSPFYRVTVLYALANRGAPRETLEETLAQFLHSVPAELGPELARFALQGQLRFVAGDFAGASALVKSESSSLASDGVLTQAYPLHHQVATQQIDLALETGDDAAAARAAREFIARSAAWQDVTPGHGVDRSFFFERLARPPTDPVPVDFEGKRRAWIEARLATGAYRGQVWSYAYAAAAFTPSEARAALEALDTLGPLTAVPAVLMAPTGSNGSPEADIGRVYLLAGRIDEAIDHLRRAVATCDLLSSPRDHMQAALNLGRALEARGETAGACEAYGHVVAQWGNARPRSVTADEARKSAKGLRCGL